MYLSAAEFLACMPTEKIMKLECCHCLDEALRRTREFFNNSRTIFETTVVLPCHIEMAPEFSYNIVRVLVAFEFKARIHGY
jgi:hypothetical protein